MGILIDSDVLIDLERRVDRFEALAKMRSDETAFLSVISASELLHGVHRADSPRIRATRLAFVEAILEAFPILEIDLATARVHAQIWSNLKSRGEVIGVHDSWLAATCLSHHLTLVTRNIREFGRIPDLPVECWI